MSMLVFSGSLLSARVIFRAAALAITAMLTPLLPAATPPVGGYHLTTLGLAGSNYEYLSSGGTVRYSAPWGGTGTPTDTGLVAGYTRRYSGSGADLGQDTWFWTGNTTLKIGLTGDGYEYVSASGTYRSSQVANINDAGQVFGYSLRYGSAGNSLGQDPWLWNGNDTQQLGLTGAAYQYTYAGGGGIYRNSYAADLNAAGQAYGYSERYNGSGIHIGRDTWLWTGSATQQLGLTGVPNNFKMAEWGGLQAGHKIGEIAPLFPKKEKK
jgi:hypothetical protein